MTYREVARVHVGGCELRATRSYRYRLGPGGFVQAAFEDGRAFFETRIRSRTAEMRHVCGNDVYDGMLRIIDAARWDLSWRISGGKELEITTSYRSAGDRELLVLDLGDDL